MTKILLTGANGQLSSAILNHPLAADFDIAALSHKQLNICDHNDINNAINLIKPDIVINPAAYTAVDKAEAEYDKALKVNQQGAANLATACHKADIPLIHISTDYVFDGNSNQDYKEDDQTNPINAYGKSKLLGEQAIQSNLQKYIILRVSGVFSEYGHNFLKSMHKLMTEKETLNIVDDQYTCPTYAGDIASALLRVAKNPKDFGIFHYCSTETLSWHSFCCKIHQYLIQQDISIKTRLINNITSDEYKTAAKRPQRSSLDCNKIKVAYRIDLPELNTGISKAIDALVKGEQKDD